MRVRLFPRANREFLNSIAWYDTRRHGLGNRFSKAVLKVLEKLLTTPLRWPEVIPGIFQAPVPRWPFVVIYQIDDDGVSVFAIFHTSRDPQEWLDRV